MTINLSRREIKYDQNSYDPSVFKEALWMMMLFAERISRSTYSCNTSIEVSDYRLFLYDSHDILKPKFPDSRDGIPQ